MASPKNVISSTERLLSLIRGKQKTGQKAPTAELPSSALKSQKRPKSNVFGLQKALNVGVDIGYDCLKLIKVRQISNKKQVIVDYRQLPFESGLPIESPQFSKFFRSALRSFCGKSKKIQLWGMASSARMEMRYLKIPKVAKKQIANAAYWTYKKEVAFEEADTIFDFHVLGDTAEGDLTKTEIMVYTAPKEDINRIRGIFTRSGITPAGITVAPFAVQNLFRCGWVSDAAANVCSLYIGREWSRIDIFANHNLILSRGIKTGINSMVEAIREEVFDLDRKGKIFMAPETDQKPADDSVEAEIEPEKPFTLDSLDVAEKLFLGLGDVSFDAEAATGQKRTQDDIFEMCLPALERLVRQVERTLGHYTVNFKKPAVTKLYLSGGVCSHQRIVEYIYSQLGLSGGIIDPFEQAENVAAGIRPPETLSECNEFMPAVGLALSNNDITPNFIHTFKDKERAASNQKISQAVLMVFIGLMVLSIGAYWYMGQQAAKKRQQVARLKQEIARYSPRINQNMILKLAANSKQHGQALKDSSRRYVSLAVIGEIAGLTPEKIRLLSIKADFGPIGPQPSEKAPNRKSDNKIVIEGIITSGPSFHQSDLAAYLVQLKNSRLFSNLTINKTQTEYYFRKPVLRFVADMRLASKMKGKKA